MRAPQDPLRREPRTVATMRLREALDMERQTSGGNAMTPLGVAGFIGGPWLDYIAEPYLLAAARGELPEPGPAIDVERVGVACDDSCGAFYAPKTIEEYRFALEHWKNHGNLAGCAHGN